jgi:outer membrane biosynthesis protein TonB
VTGDPFSPYKGIVSAVNGGNHHELPPHAARVAKMNHTLVGTRAQIAHGDLAGAHAALAALRLNLASMTDLTTGQRHAIEARIAALEAALGRATSQASAHDKQQKSGTKGSHNAVPNDSKTPEPNNTKTPEPNNTKSPEPANTEAPAPGGTHTAEPQNTKTAKPTDSAVGGDDGAGDGGAAQSTATDAASTGGGSGGGGGTAHGKGATH